MPDQEKRDKRFNPIIGPGSKDWDINPSDADHYYDRPGRTREFSYLKLFFTLVGAGIFLYACWYLHIWYEARVFSNEINRLNMEMEKDFKKMLQAPSKPTYTPALKPSSKPSQKPKPRTVSKDIFIKGADGVFRNMKMTVNEDDIHLLEEMENESFNFKNRATQK